MTRQGALAGIAILTAACSATPPAGISVRIATLASRPLRQLANGVVIRNGGFGSAMAVDPQNTGHYYLLTDRGPNLDAAGGNTKMFPVPEYAPRIGHFVDRGETLDLVATIELKDVSGAPLTGLPYASRPAGVAERAVAFDGRALESDPAGIDPEGLAVMPDGSFWVSDEYGPALLHVDAGGRTLERVTPLGANGRGWTLPRVLALRRPNNGMEGLTVTPDGRMLVGIMQGPLDNPSGTARRSRLLRILTLDVESGRVRQFLYVADEPGLLVSAIAAVTDRTFLVIERDEGFAGSAVDPARVKRVFQIDLTDATDVSDPGDAVAGRQVGGKTIEQLLPGELPAAGIRPVAKAPLLDLLSLDAGYPHDKPEGLAIVDDRTIAVSNDDDFGVVSGEAGVVPKILAGWSDGVDRNRVYFIRLARPLRPSS